ncbi:MAG: InlB B-repeat-containing protein [Bacilli bacterium]|nr:InlB B-repeat-containing protein [Bacilli bacterium]
MNLRKRIFLVLVSLLVVLGIAACTSAADTVKIAFGSDDYTVREGQTISLDINISAGSNYDVNKVRSELIYTSSDPNVAKFVDGKLIGVGMGETEIKVEWSQKAIVFDKAHVTVFTNQTPDIVFTEYSPNMLKGSVQTINYRFDPIYSDAPVRWESANPDLAVVDQNGQVTAVGVGEATIIAYVSDGFAETAFVVKINIEESDFAIEYVLNGGVNSEENPAGYNTLLTPLELKAATREGYTFAGWYADEACTVEAGTIAEGSKGDVKVYAKWDIVTYNVSYELAGGVNAEANPATYTVEDEITLANPTKVGYNFAGWYADAEYTVAADKVNKGTTGDLTVYAKWEAAVYNITYDLDGGVNAEANPATYTVEDEVVLAEPTKENHSFLGWVDAEGNAVTGIAKGSTGDVAVKATWKLNAFNITYDLNGGSFVSAYAYADHAAVVADFVKDFNAHSGKTVKADGSDFFARTWVATGSAGYKFLTSAEYSAKWSWVLNLINDSRIARGKAALTETDNQAEARGEIHTFLNLCGTTDTSGYGSDHTGLTFEAYAAKYLPTNPEIPAVVYQYEVGVETLLPLAEKADHAFIGWGVAKEETITASANSNFWGNYANHIFLFKKGAVTKALYSFRVSITMQENGSYVVSAIGKSGDSVYDYSGDYVLMISDSYGKVADTAAFKEAVQVGDVVNFVGDPATGNATVELMNVYNKISADTVGDLNLTALYAELKDNYALSYDLNGGTLSENAPVEYLCSTGLKLEMTASKSGYEFVGWSLSNGGAIVTEIPQGTRGDVTLYANYKAATYKIEYELNGGTFSVDSVAYIYDNYDALVADFLADYAGKYGLTGLTAVNFYTKTSSFGVAPFWNDAELAAKWSWLQEFILGYNENYSGLSYMKNASSAANYNKYWRANLAAFLQQGKLTSPLTMDFTGLDTEAWWEANVPTKVVTVAANPKYEYTVEELPFTLEVPMRDGVEFIGWCLSDNYRNEFLELPAGTVGDIKLYAKWSDTEEVLYTYNINYELDYGRFEGEYVNSYVETIGVSSLPKPVKVGYTFVGWTLKADSTEYVTSIGAEVVGDVTLYAHWTEKESKLPTVLYVGADKEYKTLAEALAACSKGDTIILSAGTYEGATITKTVTIKGPNADVNPNTDTRYAEAVITGDLVVAADGVVINGVNLDGKGRIKTDDNQSIDGITIANVLVTNNSHSSSSDTAFNLTVNTAYVVSNVQILNCRVEKGTGRQMALITNNIHNLTIDGCEFYATYSTYNDALKLANAGTSGVTGKLVITNNHFQDFAQYMVWVMKYGALEVVLSDNTFKHIGQTAGSHGIIRFATFTGTESDQVNLEMTYNTLEEGYMVLRIDAADKLTADNGLFVVNYNNVVSTSDTVLVKNSSTKAVVTCDSNYWGSYPVADSAFVNATHTNDLGAAEEIPSKEEAWLNGKLVVGADQTYKTIAEALAVAKEGDEIYLTAGSYDEAVTITVANLTIYGPNHGVLGTAERAAEAVLLQPVVIEAAGVTLDGVQLGATANVKVKANNVTLTNLHSVSSTFLKNGSTNRNAVVVTDGAISNLELSNSYFNIGSGTYLKGVYANDTAVTNLVIKNNYFTHEGTDNSTLSDCLSMYNSAGTLDIIGNTFEWITDDWCIMLGSTGCNAEVINVIDNSFIGKTIDGKDYYTCGIMLRKAPAGCQVNVIHNYWGYLAGTIISGRYSVAGAEFNIFFNKFENMTYRQDSSNIGSGTFNYDGNYYGKPVHSSATYCTDYGIVTDPAVCDELYAAWKLGQSIEDPEVYSNLTYVLDGGVLEAGYDVKYLEGQKVALYSASKEGFKFLGWSLDAEGSKIYKEIQKDWKGDITLYAQYVEIFELEYDLDGGESEELVYSATDGTTVKLPTPAKHAHVFLGWTLEKGSEDYISEIKVTSDVKLYANWFEATFYYITYELNGGSIKYASREELVQDFVNDYSSTLGKGYATAADISTGSFSDIDYHTFMDKDVKLANGQTPREKWLWLAEYLYELSVRDVASNNCNVLGLRALINQSAYSGDMIYGISYAFRAFLKGTVIRPGTSYTSVDHSVYENANGFWAKLSATEQTVYSYYLDNVELPTVSCENYVFSGWYKEADFSGEVVTTVSHADDGLKLYAKFAEGTPVTSVTIDNKVAELKRFETHQLTWTINPSNASIQQVAFTSSNPEVATIDDKGFINCIANGKTTITLISKSESGASDSFELVVYSPDHFNAVYYTNSYVAIADKILLLAEYIKRDGSKELLSWSSLNTEIATVNVLNDGACEVVGVSEGVVTIRAAVASNPEVYYDFIVTVVTDAMSEALAFAVENHESNHFLRYDLSIGGAYLADIFGSVSKIFYNHEMKINSEYLAAGNATNDYYANSTVEQGLEFITVHYTAGFDATADTDNHASYFTSGSADVSIHYVTGNKGSNGGVATDEIYATLDHKHGAWHAGDSNARYYSNSNKKIGEHLVFSWMPTGVKYDGCDLLAIEWTASNDFYFEINGQKTTIKLPETYNFKSRYTNHIYNADGTISAQPEYNNWGSRFDNVPVEEFFNDQAFPVKVIDGEYYMGPTWWSYGQTYAGLICGSGGNLSSIGIESCVNRGSDLWYTWQVTAQLVASLMVQYDLGIERVKGHHFFDGKHCPAPMLENNLEIWYEFIELVKAEYALLTEYKDYEYSITVDEKYASILSENGRIIAQPEFSQVVSYTVQVKVGDVVETITLATAVEGMYNR